MCVRPSGASQEQTRDLAFSEPAPVPRRPRTDESQRRSGSFCWDWAGACPCGPAGSHLCFCSLRTQAHVHQCGGGLRVHLLLACCRRLPGEEQRTTTARSPTPPRVSRGTPPASLALSPLVRTRPAVRDPPVVGNPASAVRDPLASPCPAPSEGPCPRSEGPPSPPAPHPTAAVRDPHLPPRTPA